MSLAAATAASDVAASDSVAAARDFGWLRNARFDLMFIVGVAALGLVSGAVVVLRPDWFHVILLIDLWLLGYHHVTSTFTRLTFDSDSFSEHRFLVVGLPWLVLAGTVVVGMTLGLWALATTYLYWQWFHYTRQSYGITRIYSRKAGDLTARDEQITRWALYLLPLWGILYRSHQAPERFLGMKVAYLPTPRWVVLVSAAAATVVLALWAVRQVRAARQGRGSAALTLYKLSHFVVFAAGYILIEDITHGWLVINVWHNAQYVLFVWMSTTTTASRSGVERRHCASSRA